MARRINGTESPENLVTLEAKLDKIQDRLNRRLQRRKPKSKLSKRGRSSIPGLTYWFEPNK